MIFSLKPRPSVAGKDIARVLNTLPCECMLIFSLIALFPKAAVASLTVLEGNLQKA